MDHPAGTADGLRRSRAGGARDERGSRRIAWAAFTMSAGVHLLVLLLYPGVAERPITPGAPFSVPAVSGAQGAMEVVRIVEIEPLPEPQQPEEPEVLEEVAPPEVSPRAPDVDEDLGPVLVAPGRTPAERLRPHLRERRLWQPLRSALSDLTPEQIEELRIAGRLEAWADSMAAVAAAEAAARDWTHTDGAGRRWGIAPDGIYLGDLKIPLPNFSFASAPGARDWEWSEIQRQGAAAGVRDSWKDRAQAIRARRDAERAAERRVEEPDTTRIR